MRPGETIIVKGSKGSELQRVVVQVVDNKVRICKQEEWIKTKAEHREPICVGFPLSAVMQTKRANA